jgi:hypothetical protein
MRSVITGVLALGLVLAGRPALAEEPRIDYLRDVKPILTARCYACHGALKQKGKLRLDTAALMREGGAQGPAIVVGKSAESRLIDRVSRTDERRMPPEAEGEALSAKEITVLKQWIDQGAVAPVAEKPEPDPREHWAFRAPVRPAVPTVKNVAWVRNPIDAFLAAEHDRHGLTPQPPAERRLLLRRVYLDLIGLPPTPAEMEAALRDPSPDWFERVVDRLLASPQYGERWGRHWMDIWRYSDWWGLGAEVRHSQKHIWHWRDWIIESLNADKGYDQMLREMLAADELYPTDLDRLRATGYLARSYFRFNRTTWLDEVVEHTSKAFLGLTMNCGKCHDHKYDPISQTDYYRMRAFFEPYQVRMDQLPGETNLEKDGLPRVFDCNLDAPTYLFIRGDDKRPVKDHPLSPGVPALLALGELEIKPVNLPAEAHFPGLRPFVLEDHLRLAEGQVQAARQGLEQAKKALADAEAKAASVEPARAALLLAEKTLASAAAQPIALRARAAADRARYQTPPAANAAELAREAAKAEKQAAVAKAEEDLARAELELLRTDAAKKGAVEKKLALARTALAELRKALENPGESYTPLRGSVKTPESPVESEAQRARPYPTTSSGRRSALAAWMTDPRHPLTARVAVNHIWARHFGTPLVPTVFEFGRKGRAPTHPALLDYLAVELREKNWSMKHLHRLMVTSAAYRMTSSAAGAPAANIAVDRENRWYWRMNPVRMEAQVVRDSLLHLAGELDLTRGGPSIPVTQDSRRRSLYFVHSHNDHQKFLSVFDDANVLECYRRAESIVPQQALALSNSKLVLSMAERIAARLAQQPDAGNPAVFIRAAFELLLGCRPTAEEQAACEQSLAAWIELAKQHKHPDPVQRARSNLVQALLNHNDFITVR